ncbi:MAG: rhodanese-like domain-containing protein [Piscirickettsiaceae bacterium]|jgi:rhodanese-related sulfurtransferase|nr:rhodanese-like domain-containing protein [Piscirickettsiaceae bacterium]
MAMTAMELVQAAKKTIKEVNIEEANNMIANGSIALDIREPAEYEAGNIPNSIHIPRGVLEFKIAGIEAFEDKNKSIVIYCKSGGRSALAARALEQMGYMDVCSMAGGYDLWSES